VAELRPDQVDPKELEFNSASRCVFYKGTPIWEISEREFDVLHTIHRAAPGLALNEDVIISVWRMDVGSNNLHRQTSNINKKLARHGLRAKNVNGGYYIQHFDSSEVVESQDLTVPAPTDRAEIERHESGSNQDSTTALGRVYSHAREVGKFFGRPLSIAIASVVVLLLTVTIVYSLHRDHFPLKSPTPSNPYPLGFSPGKPANTFPPKILILEFDSTDPKRYSIGRTLATLLREGSFRSSTAVVISSTDQTVTKGGDDGVAEARNIGRQRGATAVVWGYITPEPQAHINLSFAPVDSNWASWYGNSDVPSLLIQLPLNHLLSLQYQAQLAGEVAPLVAITIALSEIDQGNLDEAGRAMDLAIQTQPTNGLIDEASLRFYHALSRVLLMDNHGALADLSISVASKSTPQTTSQAMALAANLYMIGRDYNRADSYCRKIINGHDEPSDAVATCATISWEMGDSATSGHIADGIPTPNSTLPELTSLARYHLATCSMDRAIEDGRYAAAHALGDIPLTSGEFLEVERYLNPEKGSGTLVQADASGLQLLSSAASLSLAKDYDSSIAVSSRLINEQPSSTAYAIRAAARFLKNDPTGAIADVNQAILLNSQTPYLYFARAVVQEDMGHFGDAITDLRYAARLDRNNPEIEAEMGVALGELGNNRGAYEHLWRAHSIDPTYFRFYTELAMLESRQHDYAGAYSLLTNLIGNLNTQIPPSGLPLVNSASACPSENGAMRNRFVADILAQRGAAEMNLKWFGKANLDLQGALKRSPKDVNIYIMRSALDGMQKDYSKELNDIDMAIKYWSSSEVPKEDLPTLEELHSMREEAAKQISAESSGSSNMEGNRSTGKISDLPKTSRHHISSDIIH